MAEGSRARAVFTLLKNLTLAALLYAAIFGIINLVSDPSVAARGKIGIPAFLDKAGPTELIKTTKSGIQVKFAGTSNPVTINPHANVFNRPTTAVKIKDDYLGPRPHVDTEADLMMLIEECRGTYEGLEKMRKPYDCLQFFAEEEGRYYHLPAEADRASRQDPRQADFVNADQKNKTSTSYVPVKDAVAAHGNEIGTCPGPIIPYHVYWTGPATWRVEVFIKSYLYTQNLACSRLWLWLDSDRNPNAVENMLNKDSLFARFMHLVERGDIVVMPWKFPSRIPMPKDVDAKTGFGYWSKPGAPNALGEKAVADNIIEDKEGQQWLVLTPKQMTFLPVAVSDAVRFIVLHIYGGAYFDMDVLMLRDMRPLLLPKDHAFAERWGAHPHPGEYNTAIMSLSANSSLSSYLLFGGIRMGVNFHPRVLGRMAWKDGRDQEFKMFETAAFDPIWTEFNWDREGRCTVPCLRDYGAVFKGRVGAIKDEWESYSGPQLETIDLKEPQRKELKARAHDEDEPAKHTDKNPHDSFQASLDEETQLRNEGVISDYILDEDKFPPNNRTLSNFFRGSWTYHIHNQWLKHPEPSSWIAVLEHAQDGFFAGERTNPYGEKWDGPTLMPYNHWPELV
ncbi:hypothetical protein HBH56_099320 [Parastagonospora nodorum]|uniref:Snorna binding protein n=1 Tax=Phaeosphaeria nodorum (strain SN15 / ATCC MYA-4574 / FGSC 10173) TaxID=321614 RepID=A0A7U2NR93_PHANO|nr:hypothetical protein HBH56_099320 [Parastagonospora nodorum]QRD07438.1 hypothetical protein JI435_131670 [Parastagonospora nodorum SN15]KAH3930175.1 hypothetical protein HBH54_113640 [Parastagonospora nodorum]KAH3942794.1 hypothetical protein HBH53_182330 [Parastagonospora nodorum]KAH3964517.1 hypothetical protein HBH51_158440 [Parastagonospora nodorum]